MKKGIAVVALSALLAVGGTSLTAYAAEGWAQSNNKWVYYDSQGYKITNAWKKGADGLWRYLDDYGEMAVNSWVEEEYYVDANGIMAADKWLKLTERDSWTNQEEYTWYYFGSSGRKITDSWKKISDKWYHFDSNGEMETGWIMNDMYYTGDDGAMRTGWQKLYAPNDEYKEDYAGPPIEDGEDDGKYWYYFSGNGKKVVPDMSGGEYKEQKIEGAYYCFDANGAMQTGWKNVGGGSGIENYKYYGSDGKAKKGWYSVEPPEELGGSSMDVEWFYFSSNGTPKVGPAEGSASTKNITKIKGKSFLFNDKGNPVYGLQRIEIGDTGEYTAYYFGDKAASSVQKGRMRLEEGDGSETDFYFSETGRGYTGVKDNYLFYMGKVQKADEGIRYTVITLPSSNGGSTNYVVNESGRVSRNATVRDADGVKYKTGSTGALLKIDDVDVASGATFGSPVEPVWTY